jgi:hypothetical protein
LIARAALLDQVGRTASRRRLELADLRRRLANPSLYVEPRMVDFLYDTVIAFAGRESGIFIAFGTLPRLVRILEDLASYVLFGILVARASAASARPARG